eukprot:scaffold33625_cov59-Phaeocystis_antarctica.AAC.2
MEGMDMRNTSGTRTAHPYVCRGVSGGSGGGARQVGTGTVPRGVASARRSRRRSRAAALAAFQAASGRGLVSSERGRAGSGWVTKL